MTGMMLQMSAAVGAIVSISDGAVSDTVFSPSTSTATLSFTSAGVIEGTGNLFSISSTWVLPTSAAGSAYEIRATESTGTVSTGTVNSWLALSSLRSWSVVQSGAGTKVCELLIEIRRASDSVVLDSATYTLSTAVES